MKKTSYIFIVIFLAIIVGVLVWSGDETEPIPEVDAPAEVSGEITELDFSEIAFDGPYRIMLETDAGEARTVLVPSMGINLCPAQDNIVDLESLAVGDAIEARGSTGDAADMITVCESADHYLRSVEVGEWLTYENEEYSFSLEYPEGWQVATSTTPTNEPIINVYPSDSVTTEPPFTHHSDETHVSVFPQGIPTEGFIGETERPTMNFSAPINRADDYILSDETAFATYANVEAQPDGWNESGFIFAHVVIQNLETECWRDEEMISDEICDPLSGDRIIRHGEIDEAVRAQQVRILESFQLDR